ncbi:P-loop containing nucleoside triphosphate hydrolase protein [Triangularia verruculosa]|uniref:P-loop containing nucleoside triphosphate hydrolase protein n=1 Tax=Triangularia verruculosa TaxID=2587418 RepID=A0AAN6XP71_9PEZI|nr:P-loop containing nucleoside triphosphate hydrolase protein [Triangularia verruculosa]
MAPPSTSSSSPKMDPESGSPSHHLHNTTLTSLSWSSLSLSISDKKILSNSTGLVRAGEILAIMGPSGSGKTTLLNTLARRNPPSQSSSPPILLNGQPLPLSQFQSITRFVEQTDSLIGALTVRETLHFASKLSTASITKKERRERVDGLLESFGLVEQADVIVGTATKKGISGGQKRRLGVAKEVITGPRVVFLDEPTSGLDARGGWEVVRWLRGLARENNLIIVASIHQPSTATFNLFDKLLLLSEGKAHYFGAVAGLGEYYEQQLGMEMPRHVNPAEWLLEQVNIDYADDKELARGKLEEMQLGWERSELKRKLDEDVASVAATAEKGGDKMIVDDETREKKPGIGSVVMTLVHRSFIKSYRDVVAYGIRLAMYTGLAIMMGTVWLRLPATQDSIIPFTNSIFYGSAFLSFMAVAYCPAYLEDYNQYAKEKRNGLYGATAMTLSNFLVGTPYLFLISIVFSVISYWLSNFQPTAKAFFTWVFWLFLDLLAAEGLVVFMTSLFPSFVISLALVAFANGLWMSVDGFMVPPGTLNVFWKYVFHYWDYQKYVFENMMINEFSERVYACAETADGCHCMWQTDLADQCLIRGQGVLDQYGYKPGYMGKDVGIMMAIIVGYRLAGWLVLKLRK